MFKRITLFMACQALLGAYCNGLIAQEADTTAAKATAFETVGVKKIMAQSPEDENFVEIVSASKQAENLFDAPLSASVISREEIERAGCLNIPEALRLAPGLIVKEQSAGNFDVHIRGLENTPPNPLFLQSSNSTILVMIDNRPVYNYYSGGVIWEALPIDINDIERIEIIRGPSSALYGPNAATGVINIITRTLKRNGAYSSAEAAYGTGATAYGRAYAGYKADKNLSAAVSANFHQRQRSTSEYYSIFENDYKTLDHINQYMDENRPTDYFDEAFQFYPNNPRIAQNRYGLNAYLNYQNKKAGAHRLSIGSQSSESQKIFAETRFTSISPVTSQTSYANAAGEYKGFSYRASYETGRQHLGSSNFVRFNARSANIDYNYKYKNFSFRPTLSYQKAVYRNNIDAQKDNNNVDRKNIDAPFVGYADISNLAFSGQAEYRFGDKLRLVGGLRLDKFNSPSKTYYSYQTAAVYKPAKNHTLRAIFSSAIRSPFIYNKYIDMYFGVTQIDSLTTLKVHLTGDQEAKLMTVNMVELGYRYSPNKHLRLNAELYQTQITGYMNIIMHGIEDTIIDYSTGQVDLITPIVYENTPVETRERGLTVSADVLYKKFQLSAFTTYRRAQIFNYSPYLNTEKALPSATNPNPSENNVNNGSDFKHTAVPEVYGGFNGSYRPTAKLTLGMSFYYFSTHTVTHNLAVNVPDGRTGVFGIRPKTIVNLNISYKPIKPLTVFANIRNMLIDTDAEYQGGDPVNAALLFGARFSY